MTDTTEINHRLQQLANFARGFIPSRLCGPEFEPSRQDAADGVNDLQIFARNVDAVLLAYGQYFQSLGLITEKDVRDQFTDTLGTALDGNATFVLEDGIERRINERVAEFT